MSEEFHEALVTYESLAWSELDFLVRYDGGYAGWLKKTDHATNFICTVNVERDGKRVLHVIGRSSSIPKGARAVAYHWWLSHRASEHQR
jgi:hypothetical protein